MDLTKKNITPGAETQENARDDSDNLINETKRVLFNSILFLMHLPDDAIIKYRSMIDNLLLTIRREGCEVKDLIPETGEYPQCQPVDLSIHTRVSRNFMEDNFVPPPVSTAEQLDAVSRYFPVSPVETSNDISPGNPRVSTAEQTAVIENTSRSMARCSPASQSMLDQKLHPAIPQPILHPTPHPAASAHPVTGQIYDFMPLYFFFPMFPHSNIYGYPARPTTLIEPYVIPSWLCPTTQTTDFNLNPYFNSYYMHNSLEFRQSILNHYEVTSYMANSSNRYTPYNRPMPTSRNVSPYLRTPEFNSSLSSQESAIATDSISISTGGRSNENFVRHLLPIPNSRQYQSHVGTVPTYSYTRSYPGVIEKNTISSYQEPSNVNRQTLPPLHTHINEQVLLLPANHQHTRDVPISGSETERNLMPPPVQTNNMGNGNGRTVSRLSRSDLTSSNSQTLAHSTQNTPRVRSTSTRPSIRNTWSLLNYLNSYDTFLRHSESTQNPPLDKSK